jgi:7-carboxy-7-deazaguanine synthase
MDKVISGRIFNINEIFVSLQGEGTRAGMLCLFIRLQGCNLNCEWCDTKYATSKNSEESITYEYDEIIKIVIEKDIHFVEFTGGEPVLNPYLPEICKELIKLGFEVAIESNGSILLDKFDDKIIKIVDFKPPDSGMSKCNNFENIKYFTKNDEVKFVIASEKDYIWTKEIINKYNLNEKVKAVLLSPVFDKIEIRNLAEMMIADKLDARFNLQLHKYIWEPDKRGV